MAHVAIAPATRKDGPDLVRANHASQTLHGRWVQPFTDMPGFEDWFDGLVTGAAVGLVARETVSGSVVGVVNLSQIFRKGFQNAYLGYYGTAEFAGRGLMTQAVGLACRHAFGEIGLHRLEANIQPGNLPSIALVRRLGFRREGFSPRYLRIDGVWCDHERWALLADDLPP
jgi:[ribosomal protein S5]-alanine N-acetyltransferase